MRRVLTTTDEHHPDTPEGLGIGGVLHTGPLVAQVYIDGRPFLGIPLSETGAWTKAHAQADQILATCRYEYVDVRLVPDRRLSEDRRAPDDVLSRVASLLRPEPDRRWVPAGSDRRRRAS